MANFYISLSDDEIAIQIAMLLNADNKLLVQHNIASIKRSAANYFVEIGSTTQGFNLVIGCVGLIKEFPTLSRIYHICTHSEHRRSGIAKRLVSLTLDNCDTEYVYMTIREDNMPSLSMAFSMGFKFVNKAWSRSHDHMIIAVGRRTRI